MTTQTKFCRTCQTEKPIEEFDKLYNKKYPHYRRSKCKKCYREKPSFKKYDRRKHNRRRIRKQVAMKIRAIEYLGGKCQGESCPLPQGYKIPYCAFDFHHRDPKMKSFYINNFIRKKNAAESCWEELRTELDKCDLLCCICHRIVHQNNVDL